MVQNTLFILHRYYKTVAAQEPGEDNILAASYRKKRKNVSKSAHLLPFFGTDYGLCRLENHNYNQVGQIYIFYSSRKRK